MSALRLHTYLLIPFLAFWGCKSDLKKVEVYEAANISLVCPPAVLIDGNYTCYATAFGSDLTSFKWMKDDVAITTFSSPTSKTYTRIYII